MAFIREISPEEATGPVREAYDGDLKTLGYIANYTKVFALRPEIRAAWGRPDPGGPLHHGAAALRAGHAGRRVTAPLQLLNARPWSRDAPEPDLHRRPARGDRARLSSGRPGAGRDRDDGVRAEDRRARLHRDR